MLFYIMYFIECICAPYLHLDVAVSSFPHPAGSRKEPPARSHLFMKGAEHEDRFLMITIAMTMRKQS